MTFATAMLSYIAQRDHRLMRRMHRWRPPRWFRLWMICATRGGDGWLWYSLSTILLLSGHPALFRAVAAGGTAAGAGVVLFLWLKKLTGRRRPCALEPHAWATLLPPDQFSFPSGHSITAFAFAVPFSFFFPVLAVPLAFCALSIAVSRVVLGMHFLSDVMAGSLIGGALGYASTLAFA